MKVQVEDNQFQAKERRLRGKKNKNKNKPVLSTP